MRALTSTALQEVAKKDISEAEHPFAAWTGSNLNKGLGVIGFADARYKITETADPNLPWHLPFSIDELNILALWAHQLNRELRYVRVTHQIVERHAGFLATDRALLMGDFNSNTVWDREHPGRNHSMLVDKLAGLGLSSVYHRHEVADHGAETAKTYYHQWNERFGHHIDYAFLSDGTAANLRIGDADAWLAHSDHMPLILDIG
ncbi:exonuclease/endonuclease/phosphatase family protein [Pseudarthrobacter raffinosi]|uniref:endonuclease/exonuclease/phosphatase family protein n=1 Tax=Pseudarthrobacter raffinosi TaxID=2953651 RepID=UPI00208F5AF4|nr:MULTISPECIES: endonuclease/exonuclease/phosphatase family protein [unclassified Pseudarthrobacter]MCO4237150.1 endonuclease/exonuclease/phosphatase family protein [Pseudarthrobacter sp. MDT3-28]MCO4251458.1 endonuclease/exonuclease/phosphatase family protein [Pseudarthrobacter sp. MDT3-9]